MSTTPTTNRGESMSVELRSIRCHYFRATREPCMNPAVVEVLGPAPRLLCAEHAAGELQPDAGWDHDEWQVSKRYFSAGSLAKLERKEEETKQPQLMAG